MPEGRSVYPSLQHLPDAGFSRSRATFPPTMRAKNLKDTHLANRDSDRHIATQTQQLIATTDPDQATELATRLVSAIREHIDRLRSCTSSTMVQKPPK